MTKDSQIRILNRILQLRLGPKATYRLSPAGQLTYTATKGTAHIVTGSIEDQIHTELNRLAHCYHLSED